MAGERLILPPRLGSTIKEVAEAEVKQVLERALERGKELNQPFARFLATIYRIVPKVGPLKPLSFKAPTPAAQEMFLRGFEKAATRYRAAIDRVASGRVEFRNTDFDTGRPAQHGEYALADETYGDLLAKLAARRFEGIPSALRQNVLAFYGQRPEPSTTSKDEQKHWDKVETHLLALRNQH